MKVKPILFSQPMVRALLDGKKTQTRRVFKNIEPVGDDVWQIRNAHGGVVGVSTEDVPTVALDYTSHQKGDVLYVREAWGVVKAYDHLSPREVGSRCIQGGKARCSIGYRTDGPGRWCQTGCNGAAGKWRPSIHMPRWASRMTLVVTDVRVQRLQDISEEDAKAEGTGACCLKCTEAAPCGCVYPQPDYKDGFALLWDSLNEDRGFGWDVNPWVTAYTFDVIKQNVDDYLEDMAA